MPAQDFSDVFWNQFYKMRRMLEVQPFNLGGVSASGGGLDGRPGSFFGKLPQTRVTYDKSELGSSSTAGSPTLLDNLNHIRARLEALEDNDGYAEIYVASGTSAQSIPTGATYTKLTGFDTNGLSKRCTADVANDKIVFTRTGVYLVTCSMSASSGTANTTFRFSAFLNGVEQNKIHTKRKFTTVDDVGASSLSGLVDVTTSGWALDLRAAHDGGLAVNLTPVYMNLSVVYVGET